MTEREELILLRQLLEHKIEALDERIDERFLSRDKALALQAEAYDVHLEKLNHEQARLLSDRERYLQKEVHEPWKKEVDKTLDQINRTLATNSGRTTMMTIVWSTIVTLLVTGVAVYFRV